MLPKSGTRWTTVGDAIRRGRPDEARKLIRAALLANGGNVSAAAWDLFASRKQMYRWILKLQLYPDVDQIRERGDLPPWLAMTAAALRGEPMGAWERVLTGIKGMTEEEVADALGKSQYAARIEDIPAFATALVQAAAEAA